MAGLSDWTGAGILYGEAHWSEAELSFKVNTPMFFNKQLTDVVHDVVIPINHQTSQKQIDFMRSMLIDGTSLTVKARDFGTKKVGSIGGIFNLKKKYNPDEARISDQSQQYGGFQSDPMPPTAMQQQSFQQPPAVPNYAQQAPQGNQTTSKTW